MPAAWSGGFEKPALFQEVSTANFATSSGSTDYKKSVAENIPPLGTRTLDGMSS